LRGHGARHGDYAAGPRPNHPWRHPRPGGPMLALGRAMVRGGWASHDVGLIEAGRELEARAQAILASAGRLPGEGGGPLGGR
jgi:hypothetical protein